MGEQGQYFLLDNGEKDGDPRVMSFSIPLSTQGWREGEYRFAFFASCRPSSGPFVAARHDFTMTVKGGRVVVDDLGASTHAPRPVISSFRVQPASDMSGDTVRVGFQVDSGRIANFQLSNPYCISGEEALPGFVYDEEGKRSYFPSRAVGVSDNGPLDGNPAEGEVSIELDSSAWPAGVHHLQWDAIGHSGASLDFRSFAVKVRGPCDRLDVSVGDSWSFAEGTHFGRFARLQDGTLLCQEKYSTDNGATWLGVTGGFGDGAEQLRDGRVLGFDYRCYPVEGESGQYTLQRSLSTDSGRHFNKSTAGVFVPEATAAMGHGPHYGPLFMRSLVERSDGSQVGLFAGWFKSDVALCPYGRGRPYSRTYVCESSDSGQNWKYVTTIGYDQIGSEGYNEGSMRELSDGRLIAVIRTGSEQDVHCQDNPIMRSEIGTKVALGRLLNGRGSKVPILVLPC